MKLILRSFSILLIASIVIIGCRRDDNQIVESASPQSLDGELAREWFDLECTIVKETPGFFPTQAARVFGYSGITLYESVVQGWPGAESLAGQLAGLSSEMMPRADVTNQEYNWAIAANVALADIMRRMFAINITEANALAINDLEASWKNKLNSNENQAIIDRSEAFGLAISQAVYDYSKEDGGHQMYMDPFEMSNPYPWPAIEGAWVPTGATQNPLSPRWDKNRTFLGSQVMHECQPYKHPTYSTDPNSEFYKQAMDVYNIVSNATMEQRIIAEYWADDPFSTCTPAGHTFNIMSQLLEEHDASLAMSALGYAKLGVAESDVFVACWKSKYDYFLIRPVTYIRQNIDPNFNTVIGTPPFPAYTSGHASEAAAGARIFTNMFTDGSGNYPFTDRSQIRYGYPVRSFSNFEAVAKECANSRLYGGIHYDFDNQLGLSIGRAIGDAVNTRLNWPKSEFGR